MVLQKWCIFDEIDPVQVGLERVCCVNISNECLNFQVEWFVSFQKNYWRLSLTVSLFLVTVDRLCVVNQDPVFSGAESTEFWMENAENSA